MVKRRRRRHSPIRNLLIPHKGNNYKPLLFTAGSVGVLIGLLVLFEGAYLVDTKLVQQHTNFLASVLPGVLADLTNADRQSNGVGSLTVDPQLSQAAQLKANDMATNGYFAHVSPTGKTPWYWLDQVGYKYTYAGENLAVNFSDSDAVNRAWMASPTHHANIVKPQYTRVGFGIATGVYEGKETTFVVQEFATPPGASAPTAVASVEKPSIASDIAAVVKNVESPTKAATSGTVPSSTPRSLSASRTQKASAENASPTTTLVFANADTSSSTQILGAQTSGPDTAASIKAASGFFAQIAASPTHASTYVLGAIAMFMLALLLIAALIHLRIQYMEALGGGFLVVAVALALLVFNATTGNKVQLPTGGQSATVVNAIVR